MVRQIVKIDKSNFNLTLPTEFIGKKVEILAFVVDEGQSQVTEGLNGSGTIRSVEPEKKFTVLKVSEEQRSTYRFDREEANER